MERKGLVETVGSAISISSLMAAYYHPTIITAAVVLLGV